MKLSGYLAIMMLLLTFNLFAQSDQNIEENLKLLKPIFREMFFPLQDIKLDIESINPMLKEVLLDVQYVVVCKETTNYSLQFKNEKELNEHKEYIIDELNLKDYDISPLVDEFFKINTQKVLLNFESDDKKVFIIEDTTEKYFKNNPLEGWNVFHESHPNSQGIVDVSIPAYDRENQIVMVYISKVSGPLAGWGHICVFKLVDNRAVLIGRVGLWIS